MLILRKTWLIPLCIAGALCVRTPQSRAQLQVPEAGAVTNTVNLRVSPAATPADIQSQTPEAQGDAFLVHGAYAAALDVLQQADPRTAVIWNKMGIAYHHLFALDQALHCYEKALGLNPHYSEAYNNIGAVYYGKKDYSVAEKAYKRAVKYQPRSASPYSNLGTLYFAESKYKKGVRAYQRAFEIDPQIFNHDRRQSIAEPATREQRMATAFYLAEVYASAGKNDQALESLRRALSNGFNDRKRLMQDKELATLRETPEFRQLMLDEHLE